MRWKRLRKFYRRHLRCFFFEHKWVRRRRKIRFRTPGRPARVVSLPAEHSKYFETFYEKCVYCEKTRPLVEEE